MSMTKTSFVTLVTIFAFICRFEGKPNRRVINFLRERRHLLFPDPGDSETRYQVLFGLGLPMEGEVSMTLGYVLKCNYNLPYNESDLVQQRRSQLKRSEGDFALPRTTARQREAYMTRWILYGMLEWTMGRACLLRAVCESSANPFDKGYGLLGELLHAFLTPSTTHEEYESYSNREYHAAEEIGRDTRGQCAHFYPECEYSPLDYFTKLL